MICEASNGVACAVRFEHDLRPRSRRQAFARAGRAMIAGRRVDLELGVAGEVAARVVLIDHDPRGDGLPRGVDERCDVERREDELAVASEGRLDLGRPRIRMTDRAVEGQGRLRAAVHVHQVAGGADPVEAEALQVAREQIGQCRGARAAVGAGAAVAALGAARAAGRGATRAARGRSAARAARGRSAARAAGRVAARAARGRAARAGAAGAALAARRVAGAAGAGRSTGSPAATPAAVDVHQ